MPTLQAKGSAATLAAVAALCAGALNAAAAEEAAAASGAEEAAGAPTPTAHELVAAALDLSRGLTSHTLMTMQIKRPDWERSASMVAWSRGRDDTLMRFTAPAKDAGNALLKQGDNMWTYTPKLNRTIRLPYSMRSQSWAGSDFSYNDLSRSDKLLRHYQLEIVEQRREDDGRTIYTIDAVPHDDAPVVWGKEVWVLRDDHVVLEQRFYDQALTLLKRMTTMDIREVGGRVMATRMRMSKLDEPDHWTEVIIESAQFDMELPDRMFTVFELKAGAS